MSDEQEFFQKRDLGFRCNGICSRHKAKRPTIGNGARYASGQKRCQVCELFIKWDGLFCPCCHYRLRTKPRASIWKKKYHAAMGITIKEIDAE